MADEKSRSWIYDGPSVIEPQLQQNGRSYSKGTDDINGNKVEMEVWKNGDYEANNSRTEERRSLSKEELTEAKKGPITKWLVFCTFVVTVSGSMQFGYNAGCTTAPAPFIRAFINETQFNRDGLGMKFNQQAVDMIWSLAEAGFRFGGAMGSQTGGQLARRLGRKKGLLVQNVITVLSSLAIGLSPVHGSWEILMFTRLFSGFGSGIALTIVPLYLSEISPTNRRGTIGGIHFLMFALGLLLSQGLSFFSLNSEDLWPVAVSLGGVFGIFGLIMIPFITESPRYLAVTKENDDDAETVLQQLRGKNADIRYELDEMAYEKQIEEKRGVNGFVNTICCRSPGWKRPIYMAIVLQIAQQLAVITAFTFNSFETYRLIDIDEDLVYYAIIGSDALIVLAALIPIFVSDSLGRKRLVIFGYCFGLVFLILLTVFLALQQSKDLSWASWACLISMYAFVISLSVGPSSVPYIIIPEMFTQKPRDFTMALSNQIFWFSGLVMSFLFPALLDIIGPYTFIVFIIALTPMIFLLQKYLPETKKNTFVENAAIFLPSQINDGQFKNGQLNYGLANDS